MDAGRAFIKRKKQSRKKIFGEHLGKRQKSAESQNDFCGFENYTGAPIRKQKLNELNRAKVETRRMKFAKNSGVPDRVKCLGKIDSNQNQICFEIEIGKRFTVKMLISPKQRGFLTVSLTYKYTILRQCSHKSCDRPAESSSAVKLARLQKRSHTLVLQGY